MYKVHWIIDGIANVNEKNQQDAENIINCLLYTSDAADAYGVEV